MSDDTFAAKGWHRASGAFDPQLLAETVEAYDLGRPGARIGTSRELARWLERFDGLQALLESLGLHGGRPVRAVLFDKSPDANWALGWHQDRTICVTQRCDVPGFSPFSVKDGLTHVEPPFAILERMLTLRFHLDPVDGENAPLLVAEGSHRVGKVSATEVEKAALACPIVECTALAGDVWAYATPILHASERSRATTRRRVLQIDFSADELPDGLEWLGI